MASISNEVVFEYVQSDGSNDNHLNICLSSVKILSNLDSSIPGAYHIDGTYKLIKNRFPLIVFVKTGINQKLHVLAFCITSKEQEEDFIFFYRSLQKMADLLEKDFDPNYIVQDACNASRNAAIKFFPDTNILMCYFHVLLNCKKKIK
ncbi:unnamed protein product [Brachionus calyciflorus]|uniref:MULE transposase domain-containing protein n=1 Tax=Brachionus calyciflorus TaxID=104777 RepID=A0A814MDR9_9BILA|nr:unnamed protein product [Brachionus calyciflorus]